MKEHLKPAELLELQKPQDIGMVYTSVQRLEIGPDAMTVESGAEELCFICIRGSVDYEVDGQAGHAAMLDMLYLPIQSSIRFTSEDNGVLMRYGAPCDRKTGFGHIRFDEVDKDDRHKVYGKVEDNSRRDVWNFIDEKFDSSRFLTGICRGCNGGWTAWPPHEHGKEREEVYVYFNMGDSFGAQFVYDDLDSDPHAYLVREGDVVPVPHGFHPSVGCPCGGIFYAYVMVSTEAGVRDFMTLRTQTIYGDKLE